MPATIAAAKADLETRLTGIADVTVYDHEPGHGDGLRGLWLSISTFGITPDNWRIAVRLYADTSAGAKQAQDAADVKLPLIEARLLGGSGERSYGPLEWVFDFDRDAQIVAMCVLDVGREDYF